MRQEVARGGVAPRPNSAPNSAPGVDVDTQAVWMSADGLAPRRPLAAGVGGTQPSAGTMRSGARASRVQSSGKTRSPRGPGAWKAKSRSSERPS